MKILNWTQFADDPVVLAWKQAQEAGTASINQRRPLPALVEGTSGAMRRTFLKGIGLARAHDWTTPTTAFTRIVKVRKQATARVVVACTWTPSISMHDKHGKILGPPNRFWGRADWTMRPDGGRWVLTSVSLNGRCPGGPPR
jgi:hypothetical protein